MIDSAGIPLGLAPQALPLRSAHDPLVQDPLVQDPQAQEGDLARAAREFEAYLVRMLLDQMQRSVGSGGLFGGDESLKGYTALAHDALARRAAQAGGFGIARQMLEQWERGR